METDIFANRASDWEKANHRVILAEKSAEAMIQCIQPQADWDILEFGCGTGLISRALASHCRKIIAVDNSAAMLAQLKNNSINFPQIEPLEWDMLHQASPLPETSKFDAIVSSMALHHVSDISRLFKTWNSLLKPNGMVAIVDLLSEDGSFHTDTTGVYHFGFSRNQLEKYAMQFGWQSLAFETIHTIIKQIDFPIKRTTENKNIVQERHFPVFIFLAKQML